VSSALERTPAGAGYVEAGESAAWIERADRALVRMHGRDPLRMIQGLVTNDVAGAPPGRAVYAALLTPKGKMLADLRVFRRPGEVLLECAAGARGNVTDTLRKFVPPLFARFEPVEDRGVLGLYGPTARAVLARALGVQPASDTLEHATFEGTLDGGEAVVARTLYAGVDGWDIIASVDTIAALRTWLEERDIARLDADALDVLRIEAGRPRWGAELTEEVIPLEAGLRAHMISETKGCYTGQEVIVRILHRGHVNWHLRGMVLGDTAPPAPGTPLLHAEDGRKVGRITSACASPARGQTIGLGYARRELMLPASLRIGQVSGPEAIVVELPFVPTSAP
jgi:folate-binding protein YgfZ